MTASWRDSGLFVPSASGQPPELLDSEGEQMLGNAARILRTRGETVRAGRLVVGAILLASLGAVSACGGPEHSVAQPAVVPDSEQAATIAALEPPRRRRPEVAVLTEAEVPT